MIRNKASQLVVLSQMAISVQVGFCLPVDGYSLPLETQA